MGTLRRQEGLSLSLQRPQLAPHAVLGSSDPSVHSGVSPLLPPPPPLSCMMVDEAHERTLHTDVLFGLVKDIARFRRGGCRGRGPWALPIGHPQAAAMRFGRFPLIGGPQAGPAWCLVARGGRCRPHAPAAAAAPLCWAWCFVSLQPYSRSWAAAHLPACPTLQPPYFAARRPDLKLLISSATLDAEKFSEYFDFAPIFRRACCVTLPLSGLAACPPSFGALPSSLPAARG